MDTERIRVQDQADQNWGYAGKAWGDVGLQNANQNMVTWGMANDLFGVLPNTPMYGWSPDAWGNLRALTANKHKEAKSSAKGGKLNMRKKRGLTY